MTSQTIDSSYFDKSTSLNTHRIAVVVSRHIMIHLIHISQL